VILPGAMVGVLGGGQLGRMFALRARSMGYGVTVLDPDPRSPAGMVADRHIRGAYADDAALDELDEISVLRKPIDPAALKRSLAS
jgi:5-(carboxyamino)imidazole ribonucleotide synthase